MYDNGPGLDIAGALITANQLKQQRQATQSGQMQLDEQKRLAAMRPDLEAARGAAFGGDYRQLMALAPQEAIALRKQNAEQEFKAQELGIKQQEADTNAAEADGKRFSQFKDRTILQANFINHNAREALEGQVPWATTYQNLRSGVQGGLIPEEVLQGVDANNPPPPEVLQQLVQQTDSTKRALASGSYDKDWMQAAADLGYGNDYDKAARDPRVAQLSKQRHDAEIAAKGKPQTVVNNSVSSTSNTSPLTMTNTTDEQDKLGTTRQSLYALNQVKNLQPERFLGYMNKLKAGSLSQLDKINPDTLDEEDRQYLGDSKVFVSKLKQFFNAYRKVITGAGASAQELNDLEKSVLNSNLGPTEFNAMMKDTISGFERDQAISSALLKQGYELGTNKFAEKFDEIRAQGGDYNAALSGAEASVAPATHTEGKGKNAKTVTNAPMTKGGQVRIAAEHLADQFVAQKKLQPRERDSFIQAYVAKHMPAAGAQ
jgi:hypothetical protein